MDHASPPHTTPIPPHAKPSWSDPGPGRYGGSTALVVYQNPLDYKPLLRLIDAKFGANSEVIVGSWVAKSQDSVAMVLAWFHWLTVTEAQRYKIPTID